MDSPSDMGEVNSEAVALYSHYSTAVESRHVPPSSYGCSGILWNHNDQLWGITHGSIITPLVEVVSKENVEKIKRRVLGRSGFQDGRKILKKLEIHVLRENSPEFSARVAVIWSCPYLSSGLRSLTGFGWDFNDSETDEPHKFILSMFVVFCPVDMVKFCSTELVAEAMAALLAQIPDGVVMRGSPVLAISSPFVGTLVSDNSPCNFKDPSRVVTKLTRRSDEKGDEKIISGSKDKRPTGKSSSSPIISGDGGGSTNSYYTPFLNSWSEGVVSGYCGPSRILILTDARSTVGSEGGLLCVGVDKDGKPKWRIAGMLLRSICFWRGEWVGFSLACNLGATLKGCLGMGEKIRAYRIAADSRDSIKDEELEGVKKIISCPIVHIKCGFSRGSGIPINGKLGLILTCAHVVEKHELGLDVVWIKRPNQVMFLKAKVVYKTPPGMAYDVALITVGPGSGLPTVNISKDPPVQGERVWAVGYALHFGSCVETGRLIEFPILSRGIVSAVVPGKNPPLLQTTCCVQSGGSGGAIIREKDGDLLGLVVCNTAMDVIADGSEKLEAAIFPHLNISVPAITLSSTLEKYYETQDPSCLSEIHCSDERIQRIWRLQNPGGIPSIKSKL